MYDQSSWLIYAVSGILISLEYRKFVDSFLTWFVKLECIKKFVNWPVISLQNTFHSDLGTGWQVFFQDGRQS